MATPKELASTSTHHNHEQKLLERFMWLSIAASVVTIGLKISAAYVTGSVGFFSDAIESVINLVAACVGLWALKLAARPADENHNFGHAKAEYFSAQVEGSLILLAAVVIIYSAAQRLLDPQPITEVGIGLAFSIAATLLNLGVGYVLVKAGKQYRSSTLEADGHHLLTDVWTTVGVVIGIAAVLLTGWVWLDPVIALAVGFNILFTGYKLLKSAILGLLSESLPPEEVDKLNAFLSTYATNNNVQFTSVRTAAFGRDRLVSVVMQVPGEWTVSYSHAHADEVEAGVVKAVGTAETIVHIEPLGVITRTGQLWG